MSPLMVFRWAPSWGFAAKDTPGTGLAKRAENARKTAGYH
ncbi:hypothetical protein BEI_3580 [Halomonas beimenensis]|uniref:Uncharacterized protein n=1 Tax=Halomonas beimenensis TaxID=475662 RepID=A0A291PCF0_9GAMM|nr:hypothetical protein BEI_3580 [Halomonas beimenensis]